MDQKHYCYGTIADRKEQKFGVYYFNEALTTFVSCAPNEKSTSEDEREYFISLQQ